MTGVDVHSEVGLGARPLFRRLFSEANQPLSANSVTPDRRRAQDRTFGFAPKPVVRCDPTASPKQTWWVPIPVFSLHVWTEPFGLRPDRPISDHWITRNPPEDIWGFGEANARRLGVLGCESAADVRDLDTRLVRQAMTVVGERLVRELRGDSVHRPAHRADRLDPGDDLGSDCDRREGAA